MKYFIFLLIAFLCSCTATRTVVVHDTVTTTITRTHFDTIHQDVTIFTYDTIFNDTPIIRHTHKDIRFNRSIYSQSTDSVKMTGAKSGQDAVNHWSQPKRESNPARRYSWPPLASVLLALIAFFFVVLVHNFKKP